MFIHIYEYNELSRMFMDTSGKKSSIQRNDNAPSVLCVQRRKCYRIYSQLLNSVEENKELFESSGEHNRQNAFSQ